MHVPPLPPPQVPPVQRSEPQHPSLVVHVPPMPLQHAVPPRPLSAHVCPVPQQLGAVLPGVHAAPWASAQDPPVAVWQWPAMHDSPEQQSALVVHTPVGGSQQRPVVHRRSPQQPRSPVHAPEAAAQQRLTVGIPGTSTAPQVRGPAQHEGAVPVAVHRTASPSEQAPLAILHVPAVHVSPVPVQRLPVQQGCPTVPHVAVVDAQVPDRQVSPAPVHALPAQQGCPEAPHAAVAEHIPLVHASPVTHRVPSQHACPAAPHGGGGWQVPAMHVKPPVQSVPLQQACPAPPHISGVAHDPPVHTRPIAHMSPAQQGWVSAPQVGEAAQLPSVLQAKPGPQTLPAQHGSPSVPQVEPPSTMAPVSSMAPVSTMGPVSTARAASTGTLGSAWAQPHAARTTRRHPWIERLRRSMAGPCVPEIDRVDRPPAVSRRPAPRAPSARGPPA